MKTKKLFSTALLLLLGCLLVFSVGCRPTDDDDDDDDDLDHIELVKGQSLIEAQITGHMTANFKSHVNFSTATVSSGYITLAGSDGTSTAFTITLPQNIGEGSYTMSDNAIGIGTQFGYVSPNFSYVASKNLNSNISITITESGNGIIEGYFFGEMENLNGDTIDVDVDFIGAY